jgi:hypothetical protein
LERLLAALPEDSYELYVEADVVCRETRVILETPDEDSFMCWNWGTLPGPLGLISAAVQYHCTAEPGTEDWFDG